MLGVLLAACGGGVAVMVASWKSASKPFLERKVAALIEKYGPQYLGGAKVTLQQFLLGIGCHFSVGINDLKIKNLDGWTTEYLLDLDSTKISVKLDDLMRNAVQTMGSPDEVIIPEFHVYGCTLIFEKGLRSSNVRALVEAMKKQEEDEKAAEEAAAKAKEKDASGDKPEHQTSGMLDSVMQHASTSFSSAQSKATKAKDAASNAHGHFYDFMTRFHKDNPQAKHMKIIMHKVVLEGIRIRITSAMGSVAEAKVPSISIDDFNAKYGPASARTLFSLLISNAFQSAAGTLGDSVSGLGASVMSVGSSAIDGAGQGLNKLGSMGMEAGAKGFNAASGVGSAAVQAGSSAVQAGSAATGSAAKVCTSAIGSAAKVSSSAVGEAGKSVSSFGTSAMNTGSSMFGSLGRTMGLTTSASPSPQLQDAASS